MSAPRSKQRFEARPVQRGLPEWSLWESTTPAESRVDCQAHRVRFRPYDLPCELSGTALRSAGLPGMHLLDRRTRHGAIGTEHAAIASLRPQRRPTAGAGVQELTRIGRHEFRLLRSATWTRDN